MSDERRELGNINRQTSALADELDITIENLDKDDKKAEVKQDLSILAGKLRGLASNFEPDPEAVDPYDRNVTGKDREEVLAAKRGESKEEKLTGQDISIQPEDANKPWAPPTPDSQTAHKDGLHPLGEPGDPFKRPAPPADNT